MSNLCNELHLFAGDSFEFKCMREENHFGSHQMITKGYYKDKSIFVNARWNNGGGVCGSIEKMYWNECDECSLLITDEDELCSSCANWIHLMRTVEPSQRIVIEHHHYSVGSRGGFAGREFSIEFLDSSRPSLVTDRLWSQGEIPVHFRKRIPDNAKWKVAKKPPLSNFANFAQLLNP